MPVVVHRVGEQRSVGNDRAAPRAAELVVQRDRRRDGRESLECSLDDETHPDAGQALATTAHELGLCELELRRILEIVALAGGPEGAVVAAARVDELIQARPVRWLHTLLAVRTGE